MSNLEKKQVTINTILNSETYQKRFEKMLGKKSSGFISSVINLVNTNVDLSECNPQQVLACAVTAAVLDLPIDKNLGFAYILPYNSKNGKQAQFQIGYKGLKTTYKAL